MCKVTSRLSSHANSSVFALLVLLAVTRPACGQSSKDAAARAQATALFAKALAASDIRAPGSPPFELRATINVDHARGKPGTTGTYLLDWESPDQWREEVHFIDYARIRVGGKNQYWQSRTVPYEILPLLQLSYGLDFLKNLHVWSRDGAMADLRTIKFHQQKTHGIKLDCLTLIQKEQKYGPDYCFDPATGTLDSTGSTEFSNFISFGEKHFPGNIRAEDRLASSVTFEVNSISPLSETDNLDFQPPAGSTSWPSCDAPDALPIVKSKVPPGLPGNGRDAHGNFAVIVYAVIGTDGQLTSLNVLSAPDQSFADAVLTSLRQWKETPETCGGTPIPVETVIEITYELQ